MNHFLETSNLLPKMQTDGTEHDQEYLKNKYRTLDDPIHVVMGLGTRTALSLRPGSYF